MGGAMRVNSANKTVLVVDVFQSVVLIFKYREQSLGEVLQSSYLLFFTV